MSGQSLFRNARSRSLHCAGRLADSGYTLWPRTVPGECVKQWNWRRRLISHAANAYVRFVLGPVRDYTSEFVCMRRDALDEMGG